MDAAPLWDRARELDVAAARARRDDGAAYSFWLGSDWDATAQFSTLHLCANVWRAAAAMVEGL